MWRKVFESDDSGRIDYVLWSLKEILLVSNNGQRVQAFDYNNGFANWEYSLFNEQAQKQEITGLESRKERDSFYLTNGNQICLLSNKEKICIDLPSR